MYNFYNFSTFCTILPGEMEIALGYWPKWMTKSHLNFIRLPNGFHFNFALSKDKSLQRLSATQFKCVRS